MSTKVFLDTAGPLALWDQSDRWHRPATDAYLQMRRFVWAGYSTWFVFLELANAASRKPFRLAVENLRCDLQSRGRLFVPSQEDWDAAWAIYRASGPGSAGVVDLVSFLAMRRLGITRAFTNDRHFTAAGFEAMF